jgi:IS605 OrfB family transposase
MKTLRVRIKDKHSKTLDAMARECNMVWNFVNELSHKHLKRTGKFLSTYDIQKYTSGAAKEGLAIHSNTVQCITEEYVCRRIQFKKAKLRWRVSTGTRKSLGWVPFKSGNVSYKNGQLRYKGLLFSVWDSYGLAGHKLRAGSFSQDARGRWYANICVEVDAPRSPGTTAVGIDLGLKDFAALSNGERVEAQRIYRSAEQALSIAQRARKKDRVKAIHAKMANRRKDFLHKLSTRLVLEHGAIFVGNANASSMAKTTMAKSVLDAGWTTFRTMLQYKCDHAGVLFDEVNEAFSTVTCSACGSRSGPNGLKGLQVREWSCMECGVFHDRDVNAAKNILARGHARLGEGISTV